MATEPVLMENWAVIEGGTELRPYGFGLHGQVYGHERFPDGETVVTSQPAGVTEDRCVVTYSGTKYRLGEPNPEYLELYPDARERLLTSLESIEHG